MGLGGCDCYPGFGGTNSLPFPGQDDDCSTSGGTGCLAPSTEITLADGSVKLAGEIADGDKVLGLTPDQKVREQTIHSVSKYEEELLSVKFATSEIICSDSHPFFTADGGTLRAPCLDPGDLLLAENGETIEVLSVKRLGKGTVVGWQCTPDSNFFASGVLNHNKSAIAPPL